MSEMKRGVAGSLVLSCLLLSGCGTNSIIPEVRDASFSREAAQGPTGATHEVQQGETLYSIAWRHNIDYHDLAGWNDISSPYPLTVGQKLRLLAPPSTASTDKAQAKPLSADNRISTLANSSDESWLIGAPIAGDSAAGSGEGKRPSMPTTGDSLPTINDTEHSAVNDTSTLQKSSTASAPAATSTAMTSQWQWPTKGNVVGTFSDPSAITAGIDIAGQKGQPVRASRSGTVVYAGSSVRGYGNLVIIKHDDHFLTAYAHNDALKVKEQDAVKAGQIIATLGDTEADRSKLHFEIRQNGQSKDPQQFLPRS